MERNGFCSDTETFQYTVSDTFSGTRLDRYLAEVLGDRYSRSQVSLSIKSGDILVNDRTVKAGLRLKTGDFVRGRVATENSEQGPVPQEVDFEVLYEDELLIVVAKPPGLVVHPGSGNRDATLVNGLLHRYRELASVGDEQRPGIVHRLDKDTSGILLVARTLQAQNTLMSGFKNREVAKHYLALIHGVPLDDSGRVVAPIGRHRVNRQKMAVRQHGGKHAASNWKINKRYAAHCLAEIDIETGRTHQIRVHMAYIGHPVAGDVLYGPNRQNDLFPRQMLHAWRLRFNHPGSGREMEIEAPLPDDFKSVLDRLEVI
jgi:23S rRNA pseudouridine1911/1915/1917 synthase